MASRGRRRLKVLLVESDVLDVRLFQETFRALEIAHELKVASNNANAIRLLTGIHSRSILPDLVLISVSGLIQDGFELLTVIRANAVPRTIPMIILASSTDDADVSRAYELRANSYLTKPADDFVDLIGDLDRFWFRRAALPLRR
jgi:two-component system, chemotaxis family, response regulator Rcp1